MSSAGVERFGHTPELELRILAALTFRQPFLNVIGDYIQPGHFGRKAHDLWCRVVLVVWRKVRHLPAPAVLEAFALKQVGAVGYEDLLPQDVHDIRAAIEHIVVSENLDWVVDDTIQWIKRQTLVGLAHVAAEQMTRDPAGYEARLQRAMQLGAVAQAEPVSIFHQTTDRIQARREGRNDRWVSSGIQRFDQMLFGGLRVPKMGVILAPSRGGKTSLMLNIAAGAAYMGAKVFLGSHEVQIPDLTDRLHTSLTAVPTALLKQHEQLVMDQMAAVQRAGGDIKLQYWVRGTSGVREYHAALDTLWEQERWRPDLIVCDYPTLWKTSDSKADLRIQIGQKFADFFQLCKERQVAGWCGHQGNRSSHHKGRMSLADIAEDWSIIGTTDVAVLLSSTEEMEARGKVRITVGKNRDFPDGQSEEFEFRRELQRFE